MENKDLYRPGYFQGMWLLDDLKESFNTELMKYQEEHGQIVYDFHDIMSTQVAWAEQFVINLPA